MGGWGSKRDANGDRTHDVFGEPLDEAGKKFFRLRESGYKGWIDQDGNEANCPMCEKPGCTRQGFSGRCKG
jgi:hypothetical protein